MSGSGREALQDVWDWSGDPDECLGVMGGPHGCQGVVGRPSPMFRSDWDVLPNVQGWLRGPPGLPGMFRRPSRMSGSGR